MKTFTIDADNNITVFATKKEAAAASTTPFDSFSNQNELAELAAEWPMARLVEIWNGIPGVNAVTKFTNRKVATERIWKAIQSLGERPAAPAAQPIEESPAATPEPAPEVAAEPVSEPAVAQPAVEQPAIEVPQVEPAPPETLASVSEQAPEVAPATSEPSNEATPAKNAPKAKKAPKPAKTESAPRAESKTAQVVAMLKREGGATLAEIMTTMGWQKHKVRGFIAGTMKKAGYTVESFKPEGGERSYRINR